MSAELKFSQESVGVLAGLLKDVKKVRVQLNKTAANIFDGGIKKKIFGKYLHTEGLLG